MNGGYELRWYDGWAVTAHVPGKPKWSGKILVRTDTI